MHLFLDIQTIFRVQNSRCQSFWWKRIKNKSCKFILGKKEQKAMLLVGFWSNTHFGFATSFFAFSNKSGQVNLTAQKLGSIERNLSSPYMKTPYKQKFLWLEVFAIFVIFSYFLENKNSKKEKKNWNIFKMKTTKSWTFLCFS